MIALCAAQGVYKVRINLWEINIPKWRQRNLQPATLLLTDLCWHYCRLQRRVRKIEQSVMLKAFTFTESLSAHEKLFCNFHKKKSENLFHEMCFKMYGRKWWNLCALAPRRARCHVTALSSGRKWTYAMNKLYSRCFHWHLFSTAETLSAAHSTHMLTNQNALDTHLSAFKERILWC
jgi:hypothetical protein